MCNQDGGKKKKGKIKKEKKKSPSSLLFHFLLQLEASCSQNLEKKSRCQWQQCVYLERTNPQEHITFKIT